MARFKVQLSSGGLGGLFYMGELDPATANQNRAFQMGELDPATANQNRAFQMRGLLESHSPGNGSGDLEMISGPRK